MATAKDDSSQYLFSFFWGVTTQQRDPLTYAIIGAAIEVHRHLGPGVLESAYEECLCYELSARGLSFRRQVALPLIYKNQKLEIGFRPDLVIEDRVVVELKCIEKLLPVHDAQLLTYMRLAAIQTGLLINFQAQPLINGIKRFVLTPSAVSAVSAATSSLTQPGVSPGSGSSPA